MNRFTYENIKVLPNSIDFRKFNGFNTSFFKINFWEHSAKIKKISKIQIS